MEDVFYDKVCGNKQEAIEAVRKICSENKDCEIIPCDDPKRGLYGFLVSYKTGEKTEQGFPVEIGNIFSWPVVGDKALEPQEEYVSGKELLDFAQENGKLYACDEPLYVCDDPRQLIIGLARYFPDEGISKVRKTRLIKFKKEKPEDFKKIAEIRKNIMNDDNLMRRFEEIKELFN